MMEMFTKPQFAPIIKRFLRSLNKADTQKNYFARRLVGYSAIQMYSVVSDVRHYEKFVPFCKSSTILFEEPGMQYGHLVIGFPPISENYTSEVRLVKPNLVKATCRDGKLFTLLESTWKFNRGLRSNPQTCIVDYSLHFEFKSKIYSQVAGLFFDHLVDQMEDAFLKEVKRRYGKESIPMHKLQAVES